MRQALDALKTEIEKFLAAEIFVVFHGYSRLSSEVPVVHWDCDRHPDFRCFLQTASAAGVRMVVFHHREFSAEYIEDALERLEASEVAAEEHRGFERRIKDLKAYEGFTCAIELSFDHQSRVYAYNLRTDWYEDLLDILDEIDAFQGDEDEDEEPMGGYFSRN